MTPQPPSTPAGTLYRASLEELLALLDALADATAPEPPPEPAPTPAPAPTPLPAPAAPIPTPAVPVAVAPAAWAKPSAGQISALLASMLGTGVSGGSIVAAVQRGLRESPAQSLLLIGLVVVGLGLTFFCVRFVLREIHRSHASMHAGTDLLASVQTVLTPRRVILALVAILSSGVMGVGGLMVYERTTPTNAVPPAPAGTAATDTAAVANPTAPAYSVAGGGLLASVMSFLLLYRKSATVVAAPSAVDAVPDAPAPVPPPPRREPRPPRQPFVPGNPAAPLLAGDARWQSAAALFDLDSFSANVLLLTLACATEPAIAARCARAEGSSASPSAGLALALFDGPEFAGTNPGARLAKFYADAPLRAWRLIETHQPDGRSLADAILRLDEPILQYLCGYDRRDERLLPFRAPLLPETVAGGIAHSQWRVARDGITPRLSTREVCVLRGADAAARQLTAAAALGWLDSQAAGEKDAANVMSRGVAALDRVAPSSLPREQDTLAQFATLWLRQCLLLGGGLYIDADEAGTPEQMATLRLFLRRFTVAPDDVRALAPVFVTIDEAGTDLGVPSFFVEVAKPERAEQAEEWKRLVPDERAAEELAEEFDFNLPTISRLHGLAGPSPSLNGLRAVCRQSNHSRLDTLAQRLRPIAGWDDLVLPDYQKNLLRALADQVRCRARVYRDFGFERKMTRGFGISVLFTGESGTGKTTAAEVIALDLGLDLYRVDLSSVMDKYIGVTEKKLRQVFDAAEEGGVALLFDEADAIFGKRTEVKESHDRYANIQIDYLLQRLESFRGLAILASNQGDAIDQAFLRRLRFSIQFPMPDRTLRREIWERSFPDGVWAVSDKGKIDFDALAQTPLSGGQIHAIALNAAFLAARETPPRLTMRLIEHALDAELLKSGNAVRHATFPDRPVPPAPEAEVEAGAEPEPMPAAA